MLEEGEVNITVDIGGKGGHCEGKYWMEGRTVHLSILEGEEDTVAVNWREGKTL